MRFYLINNNYWDSKKWDEVKKNVNSLISQLPIYILASYDLSIIL